MADKLRLGPEIRELKIGSSFFNNKTAFHTLRYDFKPASVVGSKNATLEIGSNNQVTVTHVETSGASQTVFKGSRRPYHKECVLIIDNDTGEITLEKLQTNILLKKTRPEGRPSYIGNNSSRPPTPVDKKQSPPGLSCPPGGSLRQPRSSQPPPGTSSHPHPHPHSHPHPHHNKQSPRNNHQSPQYNHSNRNSPLIIHKSPPQLSNLSLSPSAAASLPMIEDCNDSSSNSFDIANPITFPELRDSPEFNNFQEDDMSSSVRVGVLSDSSTSDSDSNSSDSDRDNNSQTLSHSSHTRINGHVNGKGSSMANNFLKDDLQLSESGTSDSD